MNLSPPPPDNWDEQLPAAATFDDVTQRLDEELQQAALNLLNHLQARSYRTRMAGIPYGTYITIGSGRHTDDYPGNGGEAAQAPLPAAGYSSEKKHDLPADHRGKLRPFVTSV